MTGRFLTKLSVAVRAQKRSFCAASSLQNVAAMSRALQYNYLGPSHNVTTSYRPRLMECKHRCYAVQASTFGYERCLKVIMHSKFQKNENCYPRLVQWSPAFTVGHRAVKLHCIYMCTFHGDVLNGPSHDTFWIKIVHAPQRPITRSERCLPKTTRLVF